jgi:hypothetical protein
MTSRKAKSGRSPPTKVEFYINRRTVSVLLPLPGRADEVIETFFAAAQNVRFWHKADVTRLSFNVRFWG